MESDLMSEFKKVVNQVEALQDDADKADAGNKAAARRMRVGLMGVIHQCKKARVAANTK